MWPHGVRTHVELSAARQIAQSSPVGSTASRSISELTEEEEEERERRRVVMLDWSSEGRCAAA